MSPAQQIPLDQEEAIRNDLVVARIEAITAPDLSRQRVRKAIDRARQFPFSTAVLSELLPFADLPFISAYLDHSKNRPGVTTIREILPRSAQLCIEADRADALRLIASAGVPVTNVIVEIESRLRSNLRVSPNILTLYLYLIDGVILNRPSLFITIITETCDETAPIVARLLKKHVAGARLTLLMACVNNHFKAVYCLLRAGIDVPGFSSTLQISEITSRPDLDPEIRHILDLSQSAHGRMYLAQRDLTDLLGEPVANST